MDLSAILDNGFASRFIFEEQFQKWLNNPGSVDASWRELFETLEEDTLPSVATPTISESAVIYPSKQVGKGISQVGLQNLIRAYREYGHLTAHVNPLATEGSLEPPELNLEKIGFTRQDLSTFYPTLGLLIEKEAPLLKIVNTLKQIYCHKIGIEYMGCGDLELESWIQKKIEPTFFKPNLSIEQKQMILQQLNKSELLESFIHTKYVGQKRFSLEGAETLIPMLSAILDTGGNDGVEEIVLGMAHRGRLNVLSNIMNKSYTAIFSEFDEGYVPESIESSGDVKYHKGYRAEVTISGGKKLKVELCPNPSHLEAVDPVVEGMVRAKQVLYGDENSLKKVMPILIHGDAALAGQGVVYETLQMYKLEGYKTGGTIHLVINNQIGFTTVPKDSRSTRYCTDIARTFNAPVFHVNAEDPEECVYAAILATQIRQRFHCEVFIDLYCYRKYGHNESDEPAFTQPLEYQIIRKKKSIREIYRDELIQKGVLEKYLAESLEVEFKKALNKALKSIKVSKSDFSIPPEEDQVAPDLFKTFDTSVSEETLRQAALRFCEIPEGFNIHPKLADAVKMRLDMVMEGENGKPIDWGMGETLAYATLLLQGTSVRIAGQDSCRGTFSHRHAVWVDQKKEESYYPLKHLSPTQGRFDIYNSFLSENAALGFEFGYSAALLDSLVIWEAQFGDFGNGAQVVTDQFIVTAEQKWGLKSGMVLFLPHGYEGQGPEHSSARMERFLIQCGRQNMRLVNPSTPAQFFHLLRRQSLNSTKKPLIIFTPKSLLRHPECVSKLSQFTDGAFEEILDDPFEPKNIKRLVLCSGHIYYDVLAQRAKSSVKDMALIRLEQLYPLNEEKLKTLFEKYEGFKEIIWLQEEPANMGAWSYMQPVLRKILPKGKEPIYIGRQVSASTAVGSLLLHRREMIAILQALFQHDLRLSQGEVSIKS